MNGRAGHPDRLPGEGKGGGTADPATAILPVFTDYNTRGSDCTRGRGIAPGTPTLGDPLGTTAAPPPQASLRGSLGKIVTVRAV